MPALLLVRHAQASFGSHDYDVMSELGERQSHVLGQRLARLDLPDRIVTGTMTRQRATASILSEAVRGVRVQEDARWDEYDHEALLTVAADDPELRGEFAALDDPEVERRRAFQRVLEIALQRWTDGGDGYDETWESFVGRGSAAADELLEELGSGRTAVVVTSGGVISGVCAAVLGLGAEQWLALNRVMVNTSVTRVVRGRGGTNVVSINDHAHLETHDGLVTYR